MIFYITIVIGVIIDLLSKNIAQEYLINKINIFGDYLYFQYLLNSGIAFSISIPFLKILTIILIIGIFYYYFKEEKKKNDKIIDFSFGLILAGAIGNGIERVLYSNVIDFIGVKYFSVFNIADTFVSIGVVLYLFVLFKNKK